MKYSVKYRVEEYREIEVEADSPQDARGKAYDILLGEMEDTTNAYYMLTTEIEDD